MLLRAPRSLLPGLALTGAVTLAAFALARIETSLAGRAWLEPLVLAIVLGTLVRTFRAPTPHFLPGIDCAARTLLEGAVILMGATISFGAVLAAGPALLAGIVATVAAAILAGFALGRLLGLAPRLALLIACGNAICGNSAIAAVAPTIDADGDDVATAIAFTAVLGVAVVLLLPALAGALHLGPAAGGILAGLTVYAVPQVLAAAAPMGGAAVQIGTLVKLVRVLMLGPVVALLSIVAGERRDARTPRPAHGLTHFLPPFILAFLALATLRSLGLFPDALVAPAHHLGDLLTVLAMAGLGLGVDLRSVAAAGARVVLVVTLSLLLLTGLALLVLHLTGLAGA